MELMEVIRLPLAVLLAGVPIAVGVGFTIAALTTPLPERRKGKA